MRQPKYPWEKTPKGYGFFVPTLQPEELKIAALLDNQRYRAGNFKATPGVFNGLLGVLFVRS